MAIVAIILAMIAALAAAFFLWNNGFFGSDNRPAPHTSSEHTEPTEVEITTAPVSYYRVATGSSNLRIRSGPSIDYPIVSNIPNGTTVQVGQIEQGWGYVTYEDISGWSSMEYLQPVAAATDEPYVSDNGLVWNIAPTLAYEQIHRCSCGIILVGDQELDPKTGKIRGPYGGGHGGPSPSWVYDPALGLLGHPGKGDGYHSLFGMHPINTFEQSVAQAFPEHFPEWFVEESRRRLIVEMADSTLREYHEGWDGELDWYLTQEAYLGRFAIMENRKFTSDWFDAITRGTPALYIGGALDTNADLYAAQQGKAWQFINHKGEALIPFSFEHLLIIDDSTAFAKCDGKYGILNFVLTKQQLS